jgi:hypothetical protein
MEYEDGASVPGLVAVSRKTDLVVPPLEGNVVFALCAILYLWKMS